MKEKKQGTNRKSRGNYFTKGIVAVIALTVVGFILSIAPNYRNDDAKNKINVIINNNNITSYLKKDIYIDDKDNIYMSKQDLSNFFDKDIFYDEQYNQIITTYGNKIGVLVIDENTIKVNDSETRIMAPAIYRDDTYYLPISEMLEVYNIELKYSKESEMILIDSIEREQIKADIAKDVNVKLKAEKLSRTVDKIKKGEKVIAVSDTPDGWTKIRTEKRKNRICKIKIISKCNNST